jgi:signal transduction histidine kinase
VADLLQLSTIEGPERPAEPGRVDVADLVETLVREMRSLCEKRGLSLDVTVERPALAWARREDVEQILGNLVGNAVNYTDPGGRIQVQVGSDRGRLRLAVSDTGIGIPREHHERIFERFYRVDATRSRAVGGTGLGLAIVKHLVLGLNGEIELESAPGRGSTFTVSLPAAA